MSRRRLTIISCDLCGVEIGDEASFKNLPEWPKAMIRESRGENDDPFQVSMMVWGKGTDCCAACRVQLGQRLLGEIEKFIAACSLPHVPEPAQRALKIVDEEAGHGV